MFYIFFILLCFNSYSIKQYSIKDSTLTFNQIATNSLYSEKSLHIGHENCDKKLHDRIIKWIKEQFEKKNKNKNGELLFDFIALWQAFNVEFSDHPIVKDAYMRGGKVIIPAGQWAKQCVYSMMRDILICFRNIGFEKIELKAAKKHTNEGEKLVQSYNTMFTMQFLNLWQIYEQKIKNKNKKNEFSEKFSAKKLILSVEPPHFPPSSTNSEAFKEVIAMIKIHGIWQNTLTRVFMQRPFKPSINNHGVFYNLRFLVSAAKKFHTVFSVAAAISAIMFVIFSL